MVVREHESVRRDDESRAQAALLEVLAWPVVEELLEEFIEPLVIAGRRLETLLHAAARHAPGGPDVHDRRRDLPGQGRESWQRDLSPGRRCRLLPERVCLADRIQTEGRCDENSGQRRAHRHHDQDAVESVPPLLCHRSSFMASTKTILSS